MKLNNKLKISILSIILLIISLVFIILKGNTYTVKIDNMNETIGIEDLNIKIEDEYKLIEDVKGLYNLKGNK